MPRIPPFRGTSIPTIETALAFFFGGFLSLVPVMLENGPCMEASSLQLPRWWWMYCQDFEASSTCSTWMSSWTEVIGSMVIGSMGYFTYWVVLVNGVFLGVIICYNPLILTFDPNFLGHPSSFFFFCGLVECRVHVVYELPWQIFGVYPNSPFKFAGGFYDFNVTH